MQKFYEDTVTGTFFKSIFDDFCLPIYNTITEGEHLIEGCIYIYKHFVIKCLQSGDFVVQQEMQKIGDIIDAGTTKVKVLDFYLFGKYQKNISEKLLLNSNYYNEDTHVALGNYLRCLRDIHNVDLMGLYNCFNSTYIPAYIDESTMQIIELNNSKNRYTVYGVPIKFNKTYHIHINASYSLIKAVYKTNKIQDSGIITKMNAPCIFNRPFDIKISTEDRNVYKKEKSLYLMIQVPKDTRSSLVVLEENSNENSQLEFIDTKQQNPFSDKLVQYLTNNVITEIDVIPNNIQYIKDMLHITTVTSSILKNFKVYSLYDDSKPTPKPIDVLKYYPEECTLYGKFTSNNQDYVGIKIKTDTIKDKDTPTEEYKNGVKIVNIKYYNETQADTSMSFIYINDGDNYVIKQAGLYLAYWNAQQHSITFVDRKEYCNISNTEPNTDVEKFFETITRCEDLWGTRKYNIEVLNVGNSDYWDDRIKDSIHQRFDNSTIFDVTGYADSEIERRLIYG